MVAIGIIVIVLLFFVAVAAAQLSIVLKDFGDTMVALLRAVHAHTRTMADDTAKNTAHLAEVEKALLRLDINTRED